MKSMKNNQEELESESRNEDQEMIVKRMNVKAEVDSVTDDLQVLHEKKRLAEEELESGVELLKHIEKGRPLVVNVAAAP